jgi:raffinose/stachyose/melibiose transport system permease protein
MSYKITAVSLIALVLFLNFIPVYQITVNAFKTPDDYSGAGVYEEQGQNIIMPPRHWSLEPFRYFLEETTAIRAYLNTIIISIACIIILEVLGAITALILAQYRVWFSDYIINLLIGAQAIPIVMTIIAVFMVTRAIGWLDSYRGIIIALSAQSLPFTIFLFHSYYRTLPREILDAAEVDGASFWQVAFRIVLPMSGTIMATVGILIFMSIWATYLLGLILLRREQLYILSMVIQNMEIVLRLRMPVFYAGFVLMALPMLAVAWWAQRFISTGMLAGSIKE